MKILKNSKSVTFLLLIIDMEKYFLIHKNWIRKGKTKAYSTEKDVFTYFTFAFLPNNKCFNHL